MSGFIEREAVLITPPGVGDGATITVPSAASSTAGDGNLSSYAGSYLWVKSTVKAYVRFGEAGVGAATVGDIYLTPDVDYAFWIPRDASRSYVRARGTAAGTLYYRRSSGLV